MRSNLNQEAQRAHNFRNTLHTALLVAGTAMLMAAMAYSLFGWTGVVIALVVSVFGLLSLRRVSPKVVLGLYKARPLHESELPELHQLVRDLAERAELPSTPKLFYVPTKMLNAFAVGNKDDSAIAITDGLLRIMNLRQLGGILAHETAHIMNGDLKVMGLADVLNRLTSLMSTLGIFGLAAFGLGLNLPLAGMLFLIFAPTVGGLLQMGLSRAREYDADLDGATLSGDPEGLASALQVLEQKNRGGWEGLVLPGSRLPQPSLLRTHPKTDERIRRLMALLHDAPERLPEQVVVRAETRPSTSIVPPVRNPRVHWQRLGIYY
jgi:heat shock protein HtpX